MVAAYGTDVRQALAGAVPFLELFGIVAGGWQMGRAALASQHHLEQGDDDAAFYRAKVHSARFYADHHLTRTPGLAQTVAHGASAVLAVEDDAF